jgi:flagellar P-ring protein FlgI
VYALAQGPLTLGGFGGGTGGNSVQVNHLTAGRVPGWRARAGGQQAVLPGDGDAAAVAARAGLRDGEPPRRRDRRPSSAGAPARAVDPATVSIPVPEEYPRRRRRPDGALEPLPLDVDAPARIVINERTGTVVVGANVRIGAAAVAHGNLSVRISTRYDVSQPSPFSPRRNGRRARRAGGRRGGDARLVALAGGDDARRGGAGLNALGATPRDVIAIMQALKAAGALRAELVII